MNRDVEQLCKKLRKAGWEVLRLKSGHYRCNSPAGDLTVTIGSTPSSRGFQNDRAKLRRNGAPV